MLRQRERARSEANGLTLRKWYRALLKSLDKHQSVPLAVWSGFVMHGFWMTWVGADEGRRFVGSSGIL